MKAKLIVAALTGLVSASALAGYISNTGHSTSSLGECEGTAQLVRQGSGYVVNFIGVDQCSRITVNGYEAGKLTQAGQKGYGSMSVRSGRTVVEIASGSGKHSETLVVDISAPVAPKPSYPSYPTQSADVVIDFRLGGFGDILNELAGQTLSETKYLRSCGGSVTAEFNAAQDLIRLKFDNVQSCKNFDIVTANGYLADYQNKKLNVKNNGSYAGSFDIPKRMLGYGETSVKVVVKSNSGAHDDVVKILYGNL